MDVLRTHDERFIDLDYRITRKELEEMTAPLETRVAGIFAFWPRLAQLGFDELVKRAGYFYSGRVLGLLPFPC